MDMAKILRVKYMNSVDCELGIIEDIMQILLWFDERNRNIINIFHLVRNSGKANASDDTAVRYNNTDEWPAHAQEVYGWLVNLWLDYDPVNDFL